MPDEHFIAYLYNRSKV